MSAFETASSSSLSTHAATKEEVKQIAQLDDPILRNLKITQTYCELSKAFNIKSGTSANWCTFATWASKQAGVTI